MNAKRSINDELLTKVGMASAYAALIAKYIWFLHVKTMAEFDHIKLNGIIPRNPGYIPPTEVTAALGESARNIICLRPKDTQDTTPRRGKKMFLMAIQNEKLPNIIGLDWSYSGNWTLPDILKNDCPTMTTNEIFCEVVRRRGSVVTYGTISPEALRVWTKDTPQDDPSTWPPLVQVELTDLEEFD
jgi:hypothetical protein